MTLPRTSPERRLMPTVLLLTRKGINKDDIVTRPN